MLILAYLYGINVSRREVDGQTIIKVMYDVSNDCYYCF